MSISYRVMQEAVDMIIRQGTNDVCLEAGTLEESDSGVPCFFRRLASFSKKASR